MTATEVMAEAMRRADEQLPAVVANLLDGANRYACGWQRTSRKACYCESWAERDCKRCRMLHFKAKCGHCLICKSEGVQRDDEHP